MVGLRLRRCGLLNRLEESQNHGMKILCIEDGVVILNYLIVTIDLGPCLIIIGDPTPKLLKLSVDQANLRRY